jgi:hypothetical protein
MENKRLIYKVNEIIEKKGVDSLEPFGIIGQRMCRWCEFENEWQEAMMITSIPSLSYDDLETVYNTILASDSVDEKTKAKYENVAQGLFIYEDQIKGNYYNPVINSRLIQEDI